MARSGREGPPWPRPLLPRAGLSPGGRRGEPYLRFAAPMTWVGPASRPWVLLRTAASHSAAAPLGSDPISGRRASRCSA